MSTSCPATDQRRLPRKKRAPRGRDQAIFVAYRTQGHTQAELAEEHHLSQRRISQIVQRVERWLAAAPEPVARDSVAGRSAPPPTTDLAPDERLRLEQWLERERSQGIYDRAIRAFDQSPPELKTKRAGQRGDVKFQEKTTRQVPPNVQLLKVALRANEDLGRLADKPSPPQPPNEQAEAERRRWFMWQELYNLRRQAEEQRQVLHGIDDQDYMSTVQHWLAALVGDRDRRDDLDPAALAPGTPLAELSSFYSPRQEAGQNEVQTSVPGSCLSPHDREAPVSPSGAWSAEPSDGSSNASNLSHAADDRSDYGDAENNTDDDTQDVLVKLYKKRLASGSLPPDVRQRWESRLAARLAGRGKEPAADSPGPLSPEGIPLAIAERVERRMAHEARLQQFYEAGRRGLPCQIILDPADGPLPERSHRPDDYGYQPTPPPTNEETRQQLQDYLAKIRAQQAANARKG